MTAPKYSTDEQGVRLVPLLRQPVSMDRFEIHEELDRVRAAVLGGGEMATTDGECAFAEYTMPAEPTPDEPTPTQVALNRHANFMTVNACRIAMLEQTLATALYRLDLCEKRSEELCTENRTLRAAVAIQGAKLARLGGCQE